MTFIEAALAVLEQEGRPLHAREIAGEAVEQKLLSHVGKTPVQTMSARISAVVAKGKGPFTRMRPGVFALAKWGDNPPGPRKKKNPSQPQQPRPQSQSQQPAAPTHEPAAADEHKHVEAEAKPHERRDETLRETGDSDSSRRKKKRRRKKKPSDEVRDPRETESSQALEQNRSSQLSVQKQEPQKKLHNKENLEIGTELETTDKVERFLKQSSKPAPIARIAKELGYQSRRGAALVEALMLADGFERERRGLRPRFVRHRNGWMPSERDVSGEIISLERQVLEAADKLTDLAERQVLYRVRNLSIVDFARVVTLLLRRQGFGAMSPVDRGAEGEFHLCVQDRRRGGRFNTALVARRDSLDKPVDESDIMELRGALHHYDSMRGIIITTGAFTERAGREAIIANLPPVALIDGETLAAELVRNGIGVRERSVNLPTFDDTLFASLGN